MEELNLDNMQNDSGISNKELVKAGDEEIENNEHSAAAYLFNERDNISTFNDLESSAVDQHVDGVAGASTKTNQNFMDNHGEVEHLKEQEMEEVVELTEFGVPIRILQV